MTQTAREAYSLRRDPVLDCMEAWHDFSGMCLFDKPSIRFSIPQDGRAVLGALFPVDVTSHATMTDRQCFGVLGVVFYRWSIIATWADDPDMQDERAWFNAGSALASNRRHALTDAAAHMAGRESIIVRGMSLMRQAHEVQS